MMLEGMTSVLSRSAVLSPNAAWISCEIAPEGRFGVRKLACAFIECPNYRRNPDQVGKKSGSKLPHSKGAFGANTKTMRFSDRDCGVTPQLLDWDFGGMAGKPGCEALQLRIQRPRQAQIAGCAEFLLEIAFELEHVAQILRPRKSQTPIDIKGNSLIGHFPAQRLAQCRIDLM